jgi:DNA-directed RNA polymerase subunit RPC12/RpoP
MLDIIESSYVNDNELIFNINGINSVLSFGCSGCNNKVDEKSLMGEKHVCPYCNGSDLVGIIEYRNRITGELLFVEKIKLS